MKATKKVSAQCALPDGYEPQPQDILSGRTRESYNHEGNKEFRSVISKHLPLYFALEKRKKRQDLITSILDRILDDGGRFLMKEKDCWVALTRAQAHKKVSHALRDAAFRNVVRQSKVDNNDEHYYCLDSDESSSMMDRPSKRSKTERSIEDLVWTDLGISDSFEDDDDGQDYSNNGGGSTTATQSLANCLHAVQNRTSDWFVDESRSFEFKLFDDKNVLYEMHSDWVF